MFQIDKIKPSTPNARDKKPRLISRRGHSQTDPFFVALSLYVVLPGAVTVQGVVAAVRAASVRNSTNTVG